MELIDRYIHEVGRYLPSKKRVDVQAEIRSLIEDSLESRAEKLTEADVVAVLKEFGPPAKVAESYGGTHNTLIGPEYFPTFMTVLQIGVTAQIIAQGVGLAVALAQGSNPGTAIGDALIRFWVGTLMTLGIVVLIFAALERAGVAVPSQSKDWNPLTLPKIDDTEKVSRTEIGGEIAAGVIGLTLLNPLSNWAGDVLAPYIRWAGLLLVLQVLLSIYLLYKGRWQTGTRIARIVIHLMGIGLVLSLVRLGWPTIIAGWGVGDAPGLVTGIQIGLYLTILTLIWQIGKLIVQIVRSQRTADLPLPNGDANLSAKAS